MKKKTAILSEYRIYEMSNPHFQNAEIITGANKAVKGQFVRFKVIEDGLGYKEYPSEKFCFLPASHKKEFWDTYQAHDGIFEYKPDYIMELGLDEIRKIIIEPELIV